jgi:hypothetical protein
VSWRTAGSGGGQGRFFWHFSWAAFGRVCVQPFVGALHFGIKIFGSVYCILSHWEVGRVRRRLGIWLREYCEGVDGLGAGLHCIHLVQLRTAAMPLALKPTWQLDRRISSANLKLIPVARHVQ